jgi:hypothetical protein
MARGPRKLRLTLVVERLTNAFHAGFRLDA